MEVFRKPISSVFAGERRYVIPLFQRPYVWNSQAQWEPLWEDIEERAAAELEQESLPKDAPRTESPPHFLGTIVIQQRPSWGDELLSHDVIDGQQRLTTLQILIAAFHDLAVQYGEEQVARAVSTFVRNDNPIADPDVEQYKVWPTSRDEEQFRLVASGGSRAAIEKAHPPRYKRRQLQPRPRMVEAYLFFSSSVDAWLNEDGADRRGERIRVFRRALSRGLQLVSIELEKNEDPQVIFETLNARGVPLLSSDLLRNYVFQRAGGSMEAAKLHERHWARFEVPEDENTPDGPRFWEIEQRQGRFYRARLDLLVQHYLSMKRGVEAPSARLFHTYKDWIEGSKPFSSVDDELREFAKCAEHFLQLLCPSNKTRLGRFAACLSSIDTSTVYPLVLGLLHNPQLPETERDGIFVDLESFLVRRLVCRRPTKNYNRLFLQLLRDYEESGEPTRKAFQTQLLALKGDTVDWPADDQFEDSWLAVDAYRDLKSGRVDMILRTIELLMTTEKQEKTTIERRVTVEHVMPQKWLQHWPLAEATDAARELREAALHDFGNLTLVTQPLNSTLRNGPANAKLPLIAGESDLRLNRYFQGRTTWSEADITERGRKLFTWALKAWPRP